VGRSMGFLLPARQTGQPWRFGTQCPQSTGAPIRQPAIVKDLTITVVGLACGDRWLTLEMMISFFVLLKTGVF
jgi:hypothetical protein